MGDHPAAALAAHSAGAGDIVVHFDVDAVDSRDLPAGQLPALRTGVPLAAAAQALATFYRAPRLRATAFTEVNPSYEPSGAALARYVTRWLARSRRRWARRSRSRPSRAGA